MSDQKIDYESMATPALISEAWNAPESKEPRVRDRIMSVLLDRERTAATDVERQVAWPSAAMKTREEMAGLYPDPADPQFSVRLFEKREFHEARAVAAGVADGTIDPCTSTAAESVFELTPVQRIVSRFLHPMTPYHGMLLFHGVGVGKTCSAVTIAEQFLDSAPTSKVVVLVPQALKENFKRTVFDPSKLVWSEDEGEWTTRQCTGTSYLDRLGLIDNPDIKAVTYKTEEDRRNRYTITGYQAFANWIDRTLKASVPMGLTDPVAREAAENEVLRRLFSDHLIIIDEAHNLRDVGASDQAATGSTDAVVAGEAAENQGGKALNPFLRRIVLNAEGLRLVLMTATPMYNSAPEIVLLLNYLLMNDTKNVKSAMRASDIFTKDGDIKPGLPQRLLEKAARRYVSYMRGENPYTFPLRMRPLEAAAEPAALWPEVSATRKAMVLTDQDTAAINGMPLVFTEPVIGSPVEIQLRSATTRGFVPVGEGKEGDEGEGEGEGEITSDAMLDLRMQMANITYPNSMFGTGGFDFHFSRKSVSGSGHKLHTFLPKQKGFDIDSVFAGEGLRAHAPKIHRIVESIKGARGICFAYSRYIKAGALPLAIALERAGFQRKLADGRIAPLLLPSAVAPVRPVCAVCGSVAEAHDASHPFKPACYVLLTSEDEISPNFAGLVRQATTWPADPEYGPLGSNIKVVIGSQVASEGLDLKCIREMHILDSWYHLNRTDQIIGRAIRYCSHTALRAVEARQGLPPMSLNNCLIYLHVTRVPETADGPALETADMYAYRVAIGKAQMVGKVQRLLKRHAWDCNLELEAITFTGLPPRPQQDAQGNDRRSLNDDGTEMDGYSINDQDYTTYCDYQVCAHQCAVSVVAAGLDLDTSTFSVADARRIVLAKQSAVRRLFDDQVMVPETVVQDIFGDLPWEISSEALMELIDGRRFTLTRPDGVPGFLVKKAGYLVFQPSAVADTDIPMSMRYARAFQLRRHFLDSRMPVLGRAEEAGPGFPGFPVPTVLPAVPEETGTEARPEETRADAEAVPIEKVDEADVELLLKPEAIAAALSAVLPRWNAWLTFVNSGGKSDYSKSHSIRIWIWLLERYAAVPEMRRVALRWWYDTMTTFVEKRAILQFVLDPAEDATAVLVEIVKPEILKATRFSAYRIFHPTTNNVIYFCKELKDENWGICTGSGFTKTSLAGTVEKALGKDPVPIKLPGGGASPGVGGLLGFLAVKKDGEVVFKSLDTQDMKPSTKGAECGNASNLPEHHARVRILHAAGLTTDLAPLMLEDADETWSEEGRKERIQALRPEHMRDLTHQPLCLYMEVLARLFDARRVQGKRWFLSAIESWQSIVVKKARK